MKTGTRPYQCCGQAPATYIASATRQPLSVMMAQGKMGLLVRVLCGLCTKELPDTANRPINE